MLIVDSKRKDLTIANSVTKDIRASHAFCLRSSSSSARASASSNICEIVTKLSNLVRAPVYSSAFEISELIDNAVEGSMTLEIPCFEALSLSPVTSMEDSL